MNLALLDPYLERDSPVHRLDARIKLGCALAFILVINLTPTRAWPAYLAYLTAILVITMWGRIRLTGVLGRSTLALPFALMTVLGLPFIDQGTAVATFPFLTWRVTITDAGILRFVGIMARSWLAVLAAVTLAVTTRFVDILVAMRSLGMPKVLASIILLMYRYIHVLLEEASRLMRARQARSAAPEPGRESGSLRWRAQVTGRMIGTLFLRTYERSERVYEAMLARGFSGEILTLQPASLSLRHLLVGGLCVSALLAAAILANIYW